MMEVADRRRYNKISHSPGIISDAEEAASNNNGHRHEQHLESRPTHALELCHDHDSVDQDFDDNPTECLATEEAAIRRTSSDDLLITKRYSYAWSTISKILSTNLIEDESLLQLYRRFCRVELGECDSSNIDDGGLVMVKMMKLWVVSGIGILFVHPLARWMVRTFWV